MNKRTHNALLASIEKWKENEELVREGKKISLASNNCPLCRLFHPSHLGEEVPFPAEEDLCKGCPVKEKTNLHYCQDTPYNQLEYFPQTSKEFVALVTEEREFLESLLPENH